MTDGTLHEDQYTFFNHISFSSSENQKCFSQVEQKIKTHVLCSVRLFR